MVQRSARWLPASTTVIIGKNGTASTELFNYLDEVARRIGGQSGIEDERLLFSNQGVFTGAIIGSGLNLDRSTNTLTAIAGDGFPEAPLDGRQYGRQMAQWTVITASSSVGTTVPGLPQYSIQFNNPLGTFDGSAEFTIDEANSELLIGAASDWTIVPNDVASAVPGHDLTISAGTGGSAGAPAGELKLRTRDGGNNPTTGDISIETGAFNGPNGTGQIYVRSGTNSSGGGTGLIEMLSGAALGGTSGSGTFGSGQGDGSGVARFASGTATNSASGNVFLLSGDAGYFSGDLQVSTGNATTTAGGRSGEINIFTGDALTSGSDSGDINLSTGAADDVRGSINIDASTVNVVANSFTFNGSAIGGGAPYFVPSGATATIPENFQSLYVLPIDVEGTLEIFGYLIEMSQ